MNDVFNEIRYKYKNKYISWFRMSLNLLIVFFYRGAPACHRTAQAKQAGLLYNNGIIHFAKHSFFKLLDKRLNTKCTKRKRHEEHKVNTNAKKVMPTALLRMQVEEWVFQIPQVFAFVFFFVAFVTISLCVLRVKILICQRHKNIITIFR